jgi:uncharacterized membrane protein YhaH (DUF805 family)
MSSWEKTIFGDRTPRMGFWFGLVGAYVLLLLCFLPLGLLGGAAAVCSSPLSKALLAACLLIPGLLLLRVSGGRLHDLGWPAWVAFVLPISVSIGPDTVQGGIRYYCDVGILSPVEDVLSRVTPLGHAIDAISPLFTAFSFTLNGMEVSLVGIVMPVLLYLGFYPGMRGENRYGPDPWEKSPLAAVEGQSPGPTSSPS